MNRYFNRKKLYEAAAVLATGAVLTAGAVFLPQKSTGKSMTVAENGVAGVSASIGAMQMSLASGSKTATASNLVASAENAQNAEETSESDARYPEWENKLMANVENSLNVRDSASEAGAVVGKLRRGDVADITSEENGWYQISSGNLKGYVNSQYTVIGDDAKNLADQVSPATATVTDSAVYIRETADTNPGTKILATVYQGDSATVRSGVEAPEGWIAVSKNGLDGFMNASYVTVQQNLSTGITNEEEAALIEAQRKAEEEAAAKKAAEEAAQKAAQEKAAAAAAAKAAASASASQAAATQKAAYAASADDVTLLAAIIQHEAGSEIYQGQVAVGSVVMNRVRSGRYPNSVRGVIFQSGQFTNEAALSRVIAGGLRSSCVSAAQEALAGADVVGGRVSFRPVSSGRTGLVIGNHVFF